MTQLESTTPKPAPRALSRVEYERYLPLVRRIAMRLARRLPLHIAVADLVAWGWTGLLEAHGRRSGMPPEEFEAYASLRVQGAMLDYLRSLDSTARKLRGASRRVARAIHELTQELGRHPEEEEIAGALGVPVAELRTLLSRIAMAGMARLEMLDLDDVVGVASPVPAPDDEADARLLADAVAAAIDQLPPRLKQVVGLYYQEDCTLREIGAVLGVSESRACQLHSEAMHRLRAAIGKE